jgi:prevent-host-death family protein
MHFEDVNATLTDLRRQTGKLLSAVLHRNKTVGLTQHGKPVAELRPHPPLMSPEEFARLWQQRQPLGTAAAAEVAGALKAIDGAE